MSKFRKPRWRDPRLGVGVLLVALSVALGGWVFAQADRTEPLYLASRVIPVGEAITTDALEVVHVNLDHVRHLYLGVEELAAATDSGAVFIRSVPEGQLIPRDALGSASDLDVRPVNIATSNLTPVAVGAAVDLWVMIEDSAGRERGEPELVASGLQVSAVEEDDSIFASAASTVVRVLVPEEQVPRVLAALGARSQVTLVPHLHGP